MSVALLLVIYVAALVFVAVDSHVNPGKGSFTARVGVYLWSATGAALIGFLYVAWWFVRAFIGVLWKAATGSDRIQPSRRETDHAKDWIVFPQQLAAVALTGSGSFDWTP